MILLDMVDYCGRHGGDQCLITKAVRAYFAYCTKLI